jgi:hypothetical protein
MSLNLHEMETGDLLAGRGRIVAVDMAPVFRATFYGIAAAACISGSDPSMEIELSIYRRAGRPGYRPEVRAILLRGGGRASSDPSFHEDVDRWLRGARVYLEELMGEAEHLMPLGPIGWAKVSVTAEIDIQDAPLPIGAPVSPLTLDTRAFVCRPAGTVCLARHGDAWTDDALPAPAGLASGGIA